MAVLLSALSLTLTLSLIHICVRAFHDTDAAFQTLIKAGYDEAMLYDRKPVSLSELEKRLGKKKFAELLADQIDRPMGKPTPVSYTHLDVYKRQHVR